MHNCVVWRAGDGVVRIDLDPGALTTKPASRRSTAISLRCSFDAAVMAVKDPDEECDDANANDADAAEHCENAACGDGITRLDKQPGEPGYESCDDQNDNQEDGCTTACDRHRCGDAIVRQDRAPGSETPCADSSTCEGQEVCRDGRCLDPLYEACDDGNEEPADACGADCLSARCGDGVLRTDVEIGSESVCRPGGNDCAEGERCVAGRCANSAYESCDDGEESNNDACVEGCVFNRCGDGSCGPAPGEAVWRLRDGNTEDGDYCRGLPADTYNAAGWWSFPQSAAMTVALDLDDRAADCREDLFR